MHELGIMMEVVRRVEEVAAREQVGRVEKIVLQIGEIASVIPHFVRECFPAATYESSLADATLEIEMIPAQGRCRPCGGEFFLKENEGRCPICAAEDFDILSGREFMIKEIVVSDRRNV